MKLNFYNFFLILIISLGFCDFFQQKTYGQFFHETFPEGLPATWTALEEEGNGLAFSNWQHTKTGPSGMFPTLSLQSSSAFDGWMIFDSDANCSSQNQNAWLISPAIDCSGKSDIYLGFETYYRRFNDLTFIEVSTDSQQTWITFPIYETLMNNEFAGGGEEVNPAFTTLDISSVADNESSVHLAFHFKSDQTTILDPVYSEVGCAYNWQVDEVGLFEGNPLPAFDITVQDFFFAVPPNAQVPVSQIEPIYFLADIRNAGGNVATGVELEVKVENDAPNPVSFFSDLLTFPDMLPGEVQENRIFENSWMPDATVQRYRGHYTVFMNEQDLLLNNNSVSFDFAVTDSVFAKDLGGTLVSLSPTTPSSTDWSIGAFYHVPNGEGFKLTSVQFGIGNPSGVPGGTVEVVLYKWEDENEDGIAQATERGLGGSTGTVIAEGIHVIDGNSESVTMPLVHSTTGSNFIPLEDDTDYILVAHLRRPDNIPLTVPMVATEAPDYLAMTFLMDSLGTPRYNSFINETSADLTADLSPFLLYNPFLRMHINPIDTKISLPVLSEKSVSVFPNPSSVMPFLQFDFDENKKQVTLDLFNADGTLVFSKTLKNIKHEKVSLASPFGRLERMILSTGVYFLKIKTEKGSLTKKIVIIPK